MENKDQHIFFRVTAEEKRLLVKKAKENGLKLSEYVREKILFDVPILEKQSPTYKTLKTLSFVAGYIRSQAKKLSKEELQEMNQEISKVYVINGIEIGEE